MALEFIRGRPLRQSPVPQLTVVFVALCAALVLGGCGSGGSSGAGPTNALRGIVRQPPLKVGSESLPQVNPDRERKNDHFRAREGGLMLIYFGYTFCPDVCPTTLADLRIALGEFSPEQRKKVDVGMIAVDPERDTDKVLNRYLGHFFPRKTFGAFRTTDGQRLEQVEDSFNASHEMEEPDEDGNYTVAHTALVYAIDDRGVVRVEWGFGTKPADIAADIEALLAEPTGSAGS